MPEENASTGILKKCGFQNRGAVKPSRGRADLALGVAGLSIRPDVLTDSAAANEISKC
jgi:hypothetical protein